MTIDTTRATAPRPPAGPPTPTSVPASRHSCSCPAGAATAPSSTGSSTRLGTARRTVAMDLREHGESPRTGEDFTAADVVDDAVALLDALGIDRVVPVALAHAGWVALELRRRLGAERVPGIVLVDWMVLGTPPGFDGALAGLQDDAAWADVRAALFGMWTARGRRARGARIRCLHG